MNDIVFKEFNKQMNRETESAFIYLALSTHFQFFNLKGISKFFEKRYKEELEHMFKFQQFLLSNNHHPIISEIPKPIAQISDALFAFDLGLAHEKKITKHIHDLVDLIRKEDCKVAEPFLSNFVAEQIQEESMFAHIRDVIETQLGLDNIYLLDKELRDKYEIECCT